MVDPDVHYPDHGTTPLPRGSPILSISFLGAVNGALTHAASKPSIKARAPEIWLASVA